jgi:hypothetical protein
MTTDVGPYNDQSFEAAADLSAEANQFKFVKLDAAGKVVAIAAITDMPIGVLQNRPALGEMATVRVVGVTKLQADAALATPGAIIGTSADGQADAKTLADAGTEFAAGRTLEAATAAAVVFRAFVDCINLRKAS